MANDITALGFSLDTRDLKIANDRFYGLGGAADKSEKKVSSAVGGMEKSFSGLVSQIDFVKAAVIGLAASSGVGVAIAANKEFAKSVSSLSAITGAVGEDLEFYKQQAAEIGKTTTLSASQAVQAFKLIASAKPDLLSSKEALAQVTREAVALSEATGGELGLAQAASALGGVLNQFQLDASESSRVINILAEASRAGAADVVSISDSLVNVGAAANAMGINVVEVVAGLEALAAGEIKGSEAGTGLRQVLVGLEKTGKQNLMPSVVGLTKAVENLAEMNLSTTDTIKMFGQEGLAAASTITAQISTLTKLSSTLDGTNTAYTQAATQIDNLDGDLKSLNSVIESISIGVGEGLDPALRSAVQSVTGLLSSTEALADAAKTATIVVGVGLTPAMVKYTISVAAAGKASLLAGTQATVMSSGLVLARNATVAATVATNALSIATKVLLGPFGLLIAAVGFAAVAFSDSKKSSDLLNESIKTQKENVDRLAQSYATMNAQQLGQAAVKARMQQIELDKQILEIQEKQRKLQTGSKSDSIIGLGVKGSDLNAFNELTDKLRELNDQRDKVNELQAAIVQAFNVKIPNAWKTTGDAAEETAAKVKNLVGDDAYFAYTQYAEALAEANRIQKESEEEFAKWAGSIRTTTTETERLRKEIEKTKEAIASGKLRSDVGAEYIASLESQIKALDTNPFQSMTDGANDALQAMSGMFESGSKDAKKLAIAMQALNLVQAVGAVLNQGTGDPYTAFGRMAAMAAMVASLGMSIGNLNGGIEDKSAEIQANQGLNQWGEKADGISTATEETASATKKLVGINTDMLSALENLSMALSSASGLIASGVSFPSLSIDKFDFANLDLINKVIPELVGGMDIFASITQAIPNFISGTIGKLFGGSSDLTNQGILIIGGRISDLIDNTIIQAFTEVTTSGGWFRKGGVYRNYTQLSGEIGQQISLVFDGIADSVSAGAEILGLSQKQIDNAINSFNVASQEISLKGMDVDEQQKAIEAYFSNVFNDLAGAVVPFLSKFTQAGEELSETLSRLATEVSVAEYLIDNFGVTFVDKISNPEAFAKAADNLAMLAGGVENLADQVSSFTDAFASDSTKLDIYQKAVTSALEAVGLSLPATAEGMWDLMSSLDATTEAGQKQIAALLGITDTADAYYKALEKQEDAINKVSDAISSALDTLLGRTESFAKTTYETAKKYLGAMLSSGSVSTSDAFYDALTGITSATEDMFGSAAEFAYENAVSANILKGLSDLTGGQLSIEEQQLQYLEIIANNTYSNDAGLMLEGTKIAYYDNSTLVAEVVSMKNQMVSLMQQMNLKADKIESNVSRIRLNSDDQLQIAAGGL